MRRAALLTLALIAGTAASADAQDTVVLQLVKCDVQQIQNLRAQADSIWIPVAQELVAEGKFMYVQVLERDMADEWNVIWYYRASDMETFRSAFTEWFERVEDRFAGADDAYDRHCPESRQYSYRSVVHTENP